MLTLHTTTVLESYTVCHHAVVLVLCSFLTTSNMLINLFAHLYLVCYAVYKILIIHFLRIILMPIHTLEVLCLNTGPNNCTFDHLPVFLVLFYYYYFLFIYFLNCISYFRNSIYMSTNVCLLLCYVLYCMYTHGLLSEINSYTYIA